MEQALTEARRDLETIRHMMERARWYRHLPPHAPILGGLLALAGGWYTHVRLGGGPGSGLDDLQTLALVWGGVFLLTLAVQIVSSHLAARKDGTSLWSPLAIEIVHSLWPPLLVAVAFTVVLVRAGLPQVIPPLWMLCYGISGVTAGAYARPAVRVLGVAFLAAGMIDLVHPFPPGLALGGTFGLFHLLYGAGLFRRPVIE